MGKTEGRSSWLTAVKRVFRSPTKDYDSGERSSRRPRHHHDQQEQQQPPQPKKKEKKGWLFRKPTNHQEATNQKMTQNAGNNSNNVVSEAEERHAIAVAVATAKAAEAAVATAQAAVQIARLAGSHPSYYAKEHSSAIVIQTAFRGYLARRALRALKGVVKLQALVRGHNVRKQAKMTLQCMQALVRVQSRVLDQRVRLSNDGSSRKSTFSDTNSIWESQYFHDTSDRKSLSRDGSSIADEWDERAHTVEEVKAMLEHRKESALKRERTLSQAFSQQMWRSNRNKSFGNEKDIGLRESWESINRRASTDQNESFIKTVEMDNTSLAQQPFSYLPPTNHRRPSQHHQRSSSHCPPSPLHNMPRHQSPATPSPSKTRPVQVRSASPCYHRPQTPSVRSNYFYNGVMSQQKTVVPNYMAATESAMARARSYSAPRQRPSTPERERGAGSAAKKRLSYYNGNHTRSPSFKSMNGVMHMGIEQQSNYSSCYTDSLAGEISPSSTTDLRRWLR